MEFDRRHFIRSAGASALSFSALAAFGSRAFGQIRTRTDPESVDGGRWSSIPDFTQILNDPEYTPKFVTGWRPERRVDRTSTVRLDADRPEGGPHIIHNYGHSGAGVTLGFGCASLAEKWLTSNERASTNSKVVIVGAGIIGLSTAFVMKRRGYRNVTIVARALSSGKFDRPMTVSDIAGGQFDAAGIGDIGGNILGAVPVARDRRYAVLTETLAVLTERRGSRDDPFLVSGSENKYIYIPVRNYTINPWSIPAALSEASRAVSANPVLRDLIQERYDLAPFQDSRLPVVAPFEQLQASRPALEPITFGVRNTILINTANLIGNIKDYLQSDRDGPPVAIMSGVDRTINGFDDLRAIEADVIFNCAGLGGALISGGDRGAEILGRYGLLVSLARPDGIEVGANAQRYIYSGLGYMFPRSDWVVLGGAWDGDSDRALTARPAERLVSSDRRAETYFSSLPLSNREDARRARRMSRAMALFFTGRRAELRNMRNRLEWMSGFDHLDCAVDPTNCRSS